MAASSGQDIAEDFAISFWPEDEVLAWRRTQELDGLYAEDEPEPYRRNVLPLGRVAMQIFILAIELFPKKPGATFVTTAGGDEEEDQDLNENPFAVLKNLK